MAKDYVSNIHSPDLRPRFTHAMPYKSHPNPAHHLVLCDPEFSAGCGYVSRDEAAILYECSRRACELAGENPAYMVEVGSHTGWSTAHLAQPPNAIVYAVEPEFSRAMFNATGEPARFLHRFLDNVYACGCTKRVHAIPELSQDFLTGDKPLSFQGFKPTSLAGAFIDGEHEPPFPANDAKLVMPWLADTCFVAFHDVLGWPVQNGVKVFVDAGFKWRLYKTPQLMAVCWRGDFVPPDHTPDPDFNWDNWINRSLRFEIDLNSQS